MQSDVLFSQASDAAVYNLKILPAPFSDPQFKPAESMIIICPQSAPESSKLSGARP